MEQIRAILGGSDIGIVGLLLVVVAGLSKLYFSGYIKRLEKLELWTEEHDDEHKDIEERCRDRHEYKGVERRNRR